MDFVSLDLGEYWSIAFWKYGECTHVESHDGSEHEYAWQNTKSINDLIEELIHKYRMEVVVEKAHHRVPTQWTQYQDVKRLCKKYKIKLVEYKTTHIKKVVTGNGRADKDMIARTVTESGLANDVLPKNEHEHDAIACGICYLANSKC